MRFTQTLKYNMKRALPILTVAGAGLMASCSNDDEPLREVEFTYNFDSPLLPEEDVKQAALDPTVGIVYIRPIGDGWERLNEYNINFHRKNYLEPILSFSPKIKGRGNYGFKPGAASKVPEDSLWYIRQGWTINKNLQKQK